MNDDNLKCVNGKKLIFKYLDIKIYSYWIIIRTYDYCIVIIEKYKAKNMNYKFYKHKRFRSTS